MLKSCLFLSLFLLSLGCQRLLLKSDFLELLSFRVLSVTETIELGFRSGRAVYVTEINDSLVYLYHTIASPHSDGIGRWVLSDIPGSNDVAQAFVDSWAVTPSLIHAVNDPSKSIWKYANNGTEFILDPSFEVRCASFEGREDNTIYLEVRDSPYSLSGFYVQLNSFAIPTYSHVRAENDNQFYLYKLNDRWIISETPGAEEGVAYIFDEALFPGDITNTQWHYSINNQWYVIPTTIIQGDADFNIYAKLRIHRFIPGVPAGQSLRRLRNELPIPAVGLGTAGISLDNFFQVAEFALLHGYRLFDLAREYNNEAYLAELLHKQHLPTRRDVFIISKVWPTHLGFSETAIEISQSLKLFQDPYIDMYMIHYPRCEPEVEWMHCNDTVNPNGNILQSYKSLERAYSEGRIGSIGVCNLNAHQLDELVQHTVISPHAIQNYAQPGRLDMDTRLWAFDHGALFFPTSYQRHAQDIAPEGKEILGHIAYDHGVNEHLVMSRFFLQTGAVITPGSTNPAHLQQNIQVENFYLNENEMNALGWPSHDPRHHDSHASEL